MHFGKFQKRLFFSFLLIGILFFASPITFLIISNLIHQSSQYKQTTLQSVESNTRFAEICFSSAFSSIYELSSSPNLQAYGESDIGSSNYYYYAARIMEDIQNTLPASMPIDFNIVITQLHPDGLVITQKNAIPKELFFSEQSDLTTDQVEQIFQHFQKSTTALTLPIYQENTLTHLYYITNKNFNTSNCLLFLRIPISQIFSTTTPYILLSKNLPFAFSQQNQDLLDISTVLQEHLQKFPSAKEFTLQQQQVYLSDFSSNPWQIAFLYPQILSENFSFALATLTIFTILIAFVCICAFALTHMLYRPIRQILKDFIYSDFQNKQPSSLDEFAILQQNASQLKQLSNKLNALTEEQKQIRLIQQARNLLFGLCTEPEIQKNFCVSVVEIKAENDTILLKIKTTIESCVAQLDYAHFVNCSTNTIAIILQTDSIHQAHKIMSNLLACCGNTVDLYTTISDIVYGSSKICDCYKQALQILEYKYLFAECDILTISQIKQFGSKSYYYPLTIEQNLIQAIVTGNSFALTLFDELLEENFKNRKLPPEITKNFLLALIATLSRAFQTMKLSPMQLIDREINFEELILHWTDKNCLTEIRTILSDMIAGVQQRSQHSDACLLKNMQEYIHKNFSDNIMLEDMAKAFHISPKYCSTLFKKLSDDTFKNYLNRYRVEIAKEILRTNPTIKISELSQQVGFNSSNSFIRVFNKYTGETPKAFAEKIFQPPLTESSQPI